MPTQTVNLTPELDRFVKEAVARGEFNNASEVQRTALAAVVREHEERALRIARLRQEIQVGLDSGTPAEIRDIDDFLEKCAKEAFTEPRTAT